MKIAYLDLFCGLSGDMMLGALVDAGLPLAELRKGLSRIALKGYTLRSRRVLKGAVAATKVDVLIPRGHGHHHTPLRDILRLLKRSGLPPRVKADAGEVFRRLGQAEGRIHGMDPLKVEFHEVGAVDSIVDIVGACLGLHLLGVEKVHCSKVPVAGGEIRMQHGTLPNPGPATLELLKGFPLVPLDLDREVVTPTGAALLAALAHDPGRFPDMRLDATGYGAGQLDLPDRPNVVRLLLGHSTSAEEVDSIYLVETNLDNISGELIGYLFEKLFQAGAVDVYTTPIQMKKSRPGLKVSILTPPSHLGKVEDLMLRETPTFGLRRVLMDRTKLERRMVEVDTPYGSIAVKEGLREGGVIKAAPEYESARKAAERHGVPLGRVLKAAGDAHSHGRKGHPHPH